jgi:hypothetical protein
MLINTKIKRFVSFGYYADDEFIKLFKNAGISVNILDKPQALLSFLD